MVPVNGRYALEATFNYSTTATLGISFGAAVNLTFVIRRTSPTTTDLISGLFPIFDVNVMLVINLRAFLGDGTVTLTGTLELAAGDVIGLFYEANGLVVNLTLGGNTNAGMI